MGKLIAIARDVQEIVVVQPEAVPEGSPPDLGVVARFRALTQRQRSELARFGTIETDAEGKPANTESALRLSRMVHECTRLGFVEFVPPMEDSNGQPVAMARASDGGLTEESLDMIPPSIIGKIGAAVLSASDLNEEQLGN